MGNIIKLDIFHLRHFGLAKSSLICPGRQQKFVHDISIFVASLEKYSSPNTSKKLDKIAKGKTQNLSSLIVGDPQFSGKDLQFFYTL